MQLYTQPKKDKSRNAKKLRAVDIMGLRIGKVTGSRSSNLKLFSLYPLSICKIKNTLVGSGKPESLWEYPNAKTQVLRVEGAYCLSCKQAINKASTDGELGKQDLEPLGETEFKN